MDDYDAANLRQSHILKQTTTHLCNLTNSLLNNDNPGVSQLHIHYSHLSKVMGGFISLHTKNFDASKMCVHCSAIWRPGSYTVHVLPNKKRRKKSKKIIKNDDKKCHLLLNGKCSKTNNQIIHIKCLHCTKITIMSLIKPKRKKEPKAKVIAKIPDVKKKKKKKSKNKFGGLNISMKNVLDTPKVNENSQNSIPKVNENSQNDTPKVSKIDKPIKKKKATKKTQQTQLTPIQKIANINKLKLENMLKSNSSTKKKGDLSSFLNVLF